MYSSRGFSALALALPVLATARTLSQPRSASDADFFCLNNSSCVAENFAAYIDDPSEYYIGYNETDIAKPFAKYFNPLYIPPTREFTDGLASSPWPNVLGYTAHEAYDLFTRPGYNYIENGYTILPNDVLMISVRSLVPEVSGDAYDWWFGWHTLDPLRYKLWHPLAHRYAYRVPEKVDWTDLDYRQRYYGTTSFIDEYVGNDRSKLSVQFFDPQEIGFNVTAWDEVGIETIVVARIASGNHTTTGFDGDSFLMHEVRRMDNGERELRSRFWIRYGQLQNGHDLAVHCHQEMTHLGSFLPSLYEEFRNTL